jgi:TRAP-type mannitol/chloroaromatic compound transport system substrate-binding protein
MKKIDMDKMKFLLQKREKENEKKKEYNDIITMFINAMTEILYRLKDTENKKKKSEICDEMQTLRQYTNECLKRVSKYYNSKEHYINENFELFASN